MPRENLTGIAVTTPPTIVWIFLPLVTLYTGHKVWGNGVGGHGHQAGLYPCVYPQVLGKEGGG